MNPDNQKILRIGHRGAAGHEPENTLASIEKAIRLGSDYVEVDIQKTADAHLVIMHDKRVDRTTSGTGEVTRLTLARLREFDAGHGQRIPLFSEVLETVNGRTGLMAEIVTPGIAADVVRELQRHQLRSPLILASFLHSELLAVRALLKQAQTLALLEGVPVDGSRFALSAQASHVGLGFDSVTEAFVQELHSSHLAVFVYTLDDERDIERARSIPVDGIVSNYPERV